MSDCERDEASERDDGGVMRAQGLRCAGRPRAPDRDAVSFCNNSYFILLRYYLSLTDHFSVLKYLFRSFFKS